MKYQGRLRELNAAREAGKDGAKSTFNMDILSSPEASTRPHRSFRAHPGHRRATHMGTMGLPALAGCQPHPATWACPGLKQGGVHVVLQERPGHSPVGRGTAHPPKTRGLTWSRVAEDAQGTDGRRRWHGTKEGKPCWKRRQTLIPALVESVWFCPGRRRLTESPKNFLPGGSLLLFLTSPLDHSPLVTQVPWDSF